MSTLSSGKPIHPRGRLVSLVVMVAVVLAVVWYAFIRQPSQGSGLADTLSTVRGEKITCAQEGWILFVGQRTDVYNCQTSNSFGEVTTVGCFVAIGERYANVTKEAKAIASAGGAKFTCAR